MTKLSPDDRIRMELGGLTAALQITDKQLAEAIGMNASTFCMRKHNPGSYRLDEIRAIKRYANIHGVEINFD